MTLNEFNAWLEGYSASFTDGAPSAEQWETIKAKLARVQPLKLAPTNPRTLTEPVPYVWPYWVTSPTSVPQIKRHVYPQVTC